MTVSSSTLPELCHICVLEDMRAKAVFSDNTIVVTNSTGSAFTITAPDGRSIRQVSEYALSRHCPLLAAVLEFRNMHVDLPCFCKPVARALRSGFTLGYVIRDATWPNPTYAIAKGLAQIQPDGKVILTSEDGVAQVVLHSHQRRFAVCYPLLVAERPQEAQYEYVWQTQVFSVASHPARWQPAVRAALLVAARFGQSVDAKLAVLSQPAGQSSSSSDPQPDTAGDRDAPSRDSRIGVVSAACDAASSDAAPADRRSMLPRADDSIRSSLTEQLLTDGWWGETSPSVMPPGDVLLLEWTPHATYQFLPEEREVEVWVHADESCLVSSRGGKFLEHFRDAGAGTQMYAASCVPDAVWSLDRSFRYPLASLAAHALKIKSHNTTLTTAITARAPAVSTDSLRCRPSPGLPSPAGDDLFAVLSAAVVEESCVPGHGKFTAYEDGRVHVRFDDRTILHMSASQSHCKVMLPDGSVVVVAVKNPVGVQLYVEAAREFAVWAFKTPEERAEQIRMQACVRAELLNSQRIAQLCEFTATGSIPSLLGSLSPSADVVAPMKDASDRQAMVERMLCATARLLQDLS